MSEPESQQSGAPSIPAAEGRCRSRPILLHGLSATNYFFRFVLDPLATARSIYENFGPFVILHNPLKSVQFQRQAVALAVGASFNREILGDHVTWRPITVGPRGPRNSAAHRLRKTILTMYGREHECLRGKLLPPLRRASVEALGDRLAELAEEEVASWRLNEPIGLKQHARRMLERLAIGAYFRNDRARVLPLAELTHRWMSNVWSVKVNFCPVNLPGTPFYSMLRDAETLERGILDWVAEAGQDSDGKDFLSILMSSPDADGNPLSAAQVAAQIPILLVASSETCENALIWSLVMLDQHPRIAADLLDELRVGWRGARPTWSASAICRFSMR